MPSLPRPVVIAIASVVIGVWALSQVAVMFLPDYEPPAELHLAVMAVLAAVFGLQRSEDKDAAPPPQAPSPAQPPAPAPEPEPLPSGRESAADLIARLNQERRSER